MAELSAGTGGLLEVHYSALSRAADQASGISGAIGTLADMVPPACSPVVTAHSGWRFAGALSALVPAWEGRIRGQSSAVSAASAKLVSAHARYAAAEDHLVASAKAVAG